ncbi:MAG: hypothetical protein ACI8V2_005138, partial [Candidatus Latescibacterota bacterium]
KSPRSRDVIARCIKASKLLGDNNIGKLQKEHKALFRRKRKDGVENTM